MAPNPRFLELIKEITILHNKKNAGYSGAENPDAFSNFRLAELFGVSSFKGVMVRISDKFSRIASLTRDPNNDKVGESIKDTLMDLAVYSLIAICLYEERSTFNTVVLAKDLVLAKEAIERA